MRVCGKRLFWVRREKLKYIEKAYIVCSERVVSRKSVLLEIKFSYNHLDNYQGNTLQSFKIKHNNNHRYWIRVNHEKNQTSGGSFFPNCKVLEEIALVAIVD